MCYGKTLYSLLKYKPSESDFLLKKKKKTAKPEPGLPEPELTRPELTRTRIDPRLNKVGFGYVFWRLDPS